MKLKDVEYIQDLGNLKTSDGKRLKPHLIYRSAQLSTIKDKDLNLLVNKYNVKHVVDLRTPQEIKEKDESRIASSLSYWHLPVLSNEENPAINRENRLDYLDKMIKMDGGISTYLNNLYRLMVNSPAAIKGYKEIFDALADNQNEEGYLFHCTQGKDRTGIVIFLILSALGVDYKRIEKLYHSFNRKKLGILIAIYFGMFTVYGPRRAHNLNKILTAKKKYLRYSLDEINTKHGGIKNYLNNVVGLSDEQIAKLKQIYLK